ncbi:unnamed protein product [Gadus morhua 'NCC']
MSDGRVKPVNLGNRVRRPACKKTELSEAGESLLGRSKQHSSLENRVWNCLRFSFSLSARNGDSGHGPGPTPGLKSADLGRTPRILALLRDPPNRECSAETDPNGLHCLQKQDKANLHMSTITFMTYGEKSRGLIDYRSPTQPSPPYQSGVRRSQPPCCASGGQLLTSAGPGYRDL